VTQDAIRRPEFAHLEGRVRELELWRARIGGVVLLMATLGSMLGPLLFSLFTGKR